MIVLKSTHESKVAELNRCIDVLEKGNAQLIGERDTLLDVVDTQVAFINQCLTLLHDIDISTRKPGGKEQQARRIALFEEAQGIGLWPVEEVQSVTE